MRTNTRRRNRGITLIELLVVMAIIAMFLTLVGARVFRNVEKSKQVVAKNQIHEFETVLNMFRLELRRDPTTKEGLQALQVRPAGLENWDGPYMKKDVPLDPWNRPYVYRCPGQHGDFDLLALGADGQEGGEGDNKDITN